MTKRLPSWPRVAIQPRWASQRSGGQASGSAANRSSGASSRTCAEVGAHEVDIGLTEPAQHLADRVPVFLRMARLAAEWPRYRRPCALVILFMPSLFHRNLEHDGPHLDADLAWGPASDDPRLVQIARRIVAYRSDENLADGLAMTRRALARMVGMARARGAVPLILVPELTRETREEAAIRQQALQGLPTLKVTIDPAWRLPNNRHPDARANARLAAAEYLEGHGLGRGAVCPR